MRMMEINEKLDKQGKFRIKGRELLKLGNARTAHQLAMRTQVGWTTMQKYMASEKKRDQMRYIDLEILYSIFANGLGLSDEEILNLKIGDVFDISRNTRRPIY